MNTNNQLSVDSCQLTVNSKITPNQLSRIHVLLAQTGNIERKADMVEGFTNGRTFSSREMTQQEAFKMIDHLAANAPLQKVLDDVKNKMRRKIISMAYEMGWAKPRDSKAAVATINKFCTGEKSLYKKTLNKHTHKELVQLVTQFESILKKRLSNF